MSVPVNTVDTNPPVVTNCPQSTTYMVPLGTPSRVVFWTPPTATDDSGVAPVVIQTHQPGNAFVVGITHVKITFIDQAGNVVMCWFTIIGKFITDFVVCCWFYVCYDEIVEACF